MKSFLLSFVLLSTLTAVSADDYGGPYCYESKNITNKSSEDPQNRDDKNIRGTCKQIDYKIIVSFDDALKDTHRFLQEIEAVDLSRTILASSSVNLLDYVWGGKHGEVSRLYIIPNIDRNVEEFKIINRTNHAPTYMNEDTVKRMQSIIDKNYQIDENDYLAKKDGEYFYYLPYQFDEAYSWFDLINIKYMASSEPLATFYNSTNSEMYLGSFIRGVVPITSPIEGITEYWKIVKKNNGYMLIKEKTETFLDDGATKIEMVKNVSTETNKEESSVKQKEASLFEKMAEFFRHLFQ